MCTSLPNFCKSTLNFEVNRHTCGGVEGRCGEGRWPINRIITWHSQTQYLCWAIYWGRIEDMQLSLRGSEDRHKMEFPNVGFSLKVTPGLQLKHKVVWPQCLMKPTIWKYQAGLIRGMKLKRDMSLNHRTAQCYSWPKTVESEWADQRWTDLKLSITTGSWGRGGGVLYKDREPKIPAGGPEDIFIS